MSDFSNFLDDIRAWIVHKEYSDAVVTSFVRTAETTLSQTLRVKEMIVIADAITTQGRIALPVDWVEAELVRFSGGKPLEFKTNNDFYGADNKGRNWYTILGNVIEFGAPIDEVEGLSVEMAYYQFIPTMTDAGTWLWSKYYNIFLQSANAAGALYAQEYDRATQIEGLASGWVQTANDTYKRGKTSGSVLRKVAPRRIG